MIVRELITKLGFNLDEKPLQQAERGIQSLKSHALGLTAAFTAMGGILGSAGLFALVKSAASAGNALVKTSQRVGIGIEALQKFQYAAALADISNDEFTLGLQLFSKKVVEAADGSKEAAGSFVQLGVQLKDNHGKIKTTDLLLLELSDKFKKMPDGVRKTALAIDLFGRSGARMIPFLNEGSLEIKNLGKELEDFGLVMGQDTAKAGEKFNDSLIKIKVILTGIKNIVGAKLLPLFLQLTQRFIEWLKVNREIVKQRLTDTINALVTALKTLIDVGKIVFGVLEKVSNALGGAERATKLLLAVLGLLYVGRLVVGFISLTKVLWGVASAFAGVDIAAAAIPLTIAAAVVAALASIYLMYDDIKAFVEGRPSLFKPFYEKTIPVIKSIQESWQSLTSFLSDAWLVFTSDIVPLLKFFGEMMIAPFKNAYEWIKILIEPIQTVIHGVMSLTGWMINLQKEFQAFLKNIPFIKEIGDALKNVFSLGNGVKVIHQRADQLRHGDKTASEKISQTIGFENLDEVNKKFDEMNNAFPRHIRNSQTSKTGQTSPPISVLTHALDNAHALTSLTQTQPSGMGFPRISDPRITAPNVNNAGISDPRVNDPHKNIQSNEVQFHTTVNVNVQTNANPQQIGESVKKATNEELDRHLRLTLRALQGGVV